MTKFFSARLVSAGLFAGVLMGFPVFATAQKAPSAQTKTTHAMTLGDKPKYGPDFKHLDYVNPNAPKGGTVRRYAIGGFDSFNPFIIKGDAAAGIGLLFETLMAGVADDPLTQYGLIAESATVPDDLSWVSYTIQENARFHDGTPVTPDDVIFSFNALVKSGRPIYRFYYANVKKVEKTGPRTVQFSFSGPKNRELPQIIGDLPVLSKSWWSEHGFSKTTLTPPLGSGPYRIKSFEPGRYVVYERVKDYWGRDIPINRGRYNFDEIRFDYYKDQSVAMEAFKAGQYDYRTENSSKNWATAYDFPARKAGLVTLDQQKHENPVGMQGFIFNTRRDTFRDPVLRKAIAYAFDFNWSNKNLFFGQYSRTRSYFQNSELAATGLPSAEELKLLEPLRGQIPDEVFTKEYHPPATDGSGNIRPNLRKAQRLLKNAGYTFKGTSLISPKTGKPVTIEFLLVSPAFERVVLPFIRNLKRLGIEGTIRTVDPSQYQNRTRDFDFDVIISTFSQSLSPGNEQRDYWTSAAADRPGSYNFIGLKNKAVDQLVDAIIAAPDRKSLIVASKALDRVLQWGHYVIPNWHISSFRHAWWDRFGRPAKRPSHGTGFWSWWIDPAKDQKIRESGKRK